MNDNNQVQEIEVNIEQAKEAIALRDSVNKLRKNKDFKKVFLNGYFVDEAARLVAIKSDPSLQAKDNQSLIDQQIIGIGQLQQFLNTKLQLGNMAERSLVDDEATRQELLEEGI